MNTINKEQVKEFLLKKHTLNNNYIDTKQNSKKETYIKEINKIVEELYDLSLVEVEPLTEKETYVFRMRYGILDNGIKKTQQEIANELRIKESTTSGKIRQIDEKINNRILTSVSSKETMLTIEELQELKIEELNIKTTRTYNTLKRVGINKVSDITNKTISEIKEIKNLGEIGSEEIINIIHSIGLKFLNEKQE